MNLLVLSLALCFSTFDAVVRNTENFIESWNTIRETCFQALQIQISKDFLYCIHLRNIQIQRYFRYN